MPLASPGAPRLKPYPDLRFTNSLSTQEQSKCRRAPPLVARPQRSGTAGELSAQGDCAEGTTSSKSDVAWAGKLLAQPRSDDSSPATAGQADPNDGDHAEPPSIPSPVERATVKVLIVIPARGGSKRLPRKNLLAVGGVSLVARAIVAAREFATSARSCSVHIMVDTDSPEIAEEGKRWGAAVPFLRPTKLAGDATPTIDNVVFFLERLADQLPSVDAVVLLQATSPLRRAEDITRCWGEFDPEKSPSVVSVTATSHPGERLLRRDQRGALHGVRGTGPPALHGQAFAGSCYVNGSVYIDTPAFLLHHRTFVVPGCTRGVLIPSERSLDIDTAGDLAVADAILAHTETPAVHVGDRQIGGGARCFIIAEAGINHNGDVSFA